LTLARPRQRPEMGPGPQNKIWGPAGKALPPCLGGLGDSPFFRRTVLALPPHGCSQGKSWANIWKTLNPFFFPPLPPRGPSPPLGPRVPPPRPPKPKVGPPPPRKGPRNILLQSFVLLQPEKKMGRPPGWGEVEMWNRGGGGGPKPPGIDRPPSPPWSRWVRKDMGPQPSPWF